MAVRKKWFIVEYGGRYHPYTTTHRVMVFRVAATDAAAALRQAKKELGPNVAIDSQCGGRADKPRCPDLPCRADQEKQSRREKEERDEAILRAAVKILARRARR